MAFRFNTDRVQAHCLHTSIQSYVGDKTPPSTKTVVDLIALSSAGRDREIKILSRNQEQAEIMTERGQETS